MCIKGVDLEEFLLDLYKDFPGVEQLVRSLAKRLKAERNLKTNEDLFASNPSVKKELPVGLHNKLFAGQKLFDEGGERALIRKTAHIRFPDMCAKKPITYTFDSAVPKAQRDAITAAFQLWETETTRKGVQVVFFSVASGKPANVKVQVSDNSGAYTSFTSPVLMNVPSELFTSDLTLFKIKTLHEIGHILSLEHEHQRSDASEFTDVVQSYGLDGGKTEQGYSYQPMPTYTSDFGDFDFESIMNYPATVNGKQGKTITRKYGLSEGDKKAIYEIYKANTKVKRKT